MLDNPELSQATPEKTIHAAERVLEKNIHEEKLKLYSEVYKRSKDIDAPTDADWHDIFSELRTGHEDLLKSLHIDSPESLQDFVFQRTEATRVKSKIRDNNLTKAEAQNLLEKSPQVLAEAYMRTSLLDLISDGYHPKNIAHLEYIAQLPNPERIVSAVAQTESLYYIYSSYKNLHPYGYFMLKANLAARKEPHYQDEFHDMLENLERQGVALSEDQTQELKEFFIEDDSPYLHQKRLFYTPLGISSTVSAPSFEDEPALQGLMDVKEAWIDFSLLGRDATPEIKTQARAMISRNLYFQKHPVTEENARAEWQRIISARETYRDQPIFRNRNVLLLAHEEKIPGYSIKKEIHGDDHARFGRDALMDGIKGQQGEGVALERIRPEDATPESILKAKEAAIARIKTMPIPATFFIEMHGSPDAVYFASGDIIAGEVRDTEVSRKITVDELATCFRERAGAFGDRLGTKEGRDIIVSSACFSSSFIRKFYAKLGDVQKPIFLGSSEYGSYGKSSFVESTGSKFSATILDLDNTDADASTTIGDVFDNELRGLEDDTREHSSRTNPTIYIPDEKHGFMQITQNGPERTTDEVV